MVSERQKWIMYELDNAKDQVMTVCTLALANVLMRTRDLYFLADYDMRSGASLQKRPRHAALPPRQAARSLFDRGSGMSNSRCVERSRA